MARFFTSLAIFISVACAAALVVPGFGSSEPAPAPEPYIIDSGVVATDPQQGFPPESPYIIDLGVVATDPQQGFPPESPSIIDLGVVPTDPQQGFPPESPSIIDLGVVPTDPHQGFPPEPQPGFYDFVDSCVEKISPKCGKEIFDGLLAEKQVSDLCCFHLIKNGKACHNAFVWVLMHLETYKEFVPIIAKRKDEVWEECRYYH